MISIHWLIPIVLFCLLVGWELNRKWVEARSDPFMGTHEMPDRIPMRNRYEPDIGNLNDASRQMNMADQILSDQAKVHAEPGRETHLPAPGEPGYTPPSGKLLYVADASLSILLEREGYATHIHYDELGFEIDRQVEGGWTAVAISRLALALAVQQDVIVPQAVRDALDAALSLAVDIADCTPDDEQKEQAMRLDHLVRRANLTLAIS